VIWEGLLRTGFLAAGRCSPVSFLADARL